MRGAKVRVQLNVSDNVVFVRSSSWMSRALDHQWLKLLLCILLIYPLIIWPIRRLFEGRWHVAGSAYALARWVHLEGSAPGEGVEAFCGRTGRVATDDLRVAPGGVAQLVGVTEEEWFDTWESTLINFALGKVKAEVGTMLGSPPALGSSPPV